MTIAQTGGDPQQVWQWLNSLGTPALAFIVLALMAGWLITKREADAKDKRIAALELEREQLWDLYLRSQGVVRDAVDLAKQRRS